LGIASSKNASISSISLADSPVVSTLVVSCPVLVDLMDSDSVVLPAVLEFTDRLVIDDNEGTLEGIEETLGCELGVFQGGTSTGTLTRVPCQHLLAVPGIGHVE
jgi:hypothetical protein